MTASGPGAPGAGQPRRTPYELVFMEGEFESLVFPRIEREAEENGVDAGEPERFEFLTVAADVIREVTPEDAPPEALDQYRLLLFHAFNFWRAGRPLYVLDSHVARFIVETDVRLEGWDFRMPADSIYLQLPANLFWGSISPELTPEPIDGFFLSASRRADHRGVLVAHLEILLVMGIHRARAGFSVIPLRTEVEGSGAAAWSGEPREGGDFSNTLPGGEISGLYSLLTTGEVLKLVGRALAYIDRHPEALREIRSDGAPRDGDPPATHLPHVRITLGE